MSSSTAHAEPLAIIGIGCLFPGASDFASFWSRIVNRYDAIRSVPPSHWQAEDYLDPDPRSPDRVYAARGGFLDPVPFNTAAFGIPPSNLEATDSSQLLGLVVAQQALEDCGYAISSSERPATPGTRAIDRSRVSVILGVTGTLQLVIPLGARLGHPLWRRALAEAGVPDEVANDVVERIADGYVGWQENSFPGLLGNVVAGRIANRFDLGGTNCVVDAACASSLSAIHLAAMELTTGRADVVLTGGVDTFNDVFMFTCFSKTPALSPSGNARPFDANGDGTVLGEGLGMIVLKRLADARRDGDRIYAILRGVGSSSDGKGNAIYAPRKEGQIHALRTAYQVAGVGPESIELIEAHGTGTRVGDATEVSALCEVFAGARSTSRWCALGSIKSQIGHTKAAAGVAGLIKAVAALYHKVLPPTIKVQQPLPILQQPDCPFYVNTEKRPWVSSHGPRRAAVSAFGFGGSNFHAVLEEADSVKPGIDWTGEVQLIALTADSPSGLVSALEAWPAELSWPELCQRATASRQNFRADAPVRLLLVVQRERTDRGRQLRVAREALGGAINGLVARVEEGVFLGAGPAPGQLAVLFPGQGAQYVGMFRDLTCHFPAALDLLTRADAGFQSQTGRRLVDCLYPPPAFTPEERTRQDEVLRATEVAQPALGVVCLGAWRVLESFGVRGEAFAGHSYGELTALCAAGWLAEADFLALSRLRGELMAQAGRGRDAGTMLAVRASQSEVAAVLADQGIDCTLANKNAPRQIVLSGSKADIDRAAAALAARKISTVRLDVAAAFHSPLVAPAREPFLEALNRIAIQAGLPVYANTTAALYPTDPAQARALLAGQLVRPVEWIQQIENLYAAGVRTFLEVGPGARLVGLVEQILAGRDAAACSVDSSSGQRNGFHDLAMALAWLAARGHRVDLSPWAPVSGTLVEVKKSPAIVELTGAQYRKPRPPRPPRPAGEITPRRSPIPSDANHESSRPAPVHAERPSAVSGPGSPMTPPPSINIPSEAVQGALEMTRENVVALQRLQEQAAQLHRQFLEGQDQAQRTLQLLVEQQQRLLQASLGLPLQPFSVAAPAVPAAVPISAPPVTPAPSAPSAPVIPPPSAPPTVVVPSVPPPPQPVQSAPVESTHIAEQKASRVLLEVISEKTGYPIESLELSMTLDADLGIDSIKRVEILSALQERLPEAPAVKPEHLGSLHTLGDIATFLAGSASTAATDGLASEPPRVSGRSSEPPRVSGWSDASYQSNGFHESHSSLDHAQQVLLEVISEKTGYPIESLELSMTLDADLGIDSIKRVEILSALQERLPEAPAVKPEHLGSLHTLGDIATFLAGSASTAATDGLASEPPRASGRSESPTTHADELASAAAVSTAALDRLVVEPVPLTEHRMPRLLPAGSEVWINEEDPELARVLASRLTASGWKTRLASTPELLRQSGDPRAVILLAPACGASEDWLQQTLQVVQKAGPALRRHQGVLLTVSKLDGVFGLGGGRPAREPLDGALAGLAKTVSREWPEVQSRAVDVAPELPVEKVADRLVEELQSTGPLEVGLTSRGTITLTCQQVAVAAGQQAPCQPGEVVVLSGGARGVTAEVALALARAFRPTVVLLGRTPEPGIEPPELSALTDENALRQAISRRTPGLAPRLVREEVQQILSGRQVRTTLSRLRETGVTALYRQVDVRDASAVARVLREIRQQHGPICGLVHGAGVLADARLEDKTPGQFAQVFQTKVGGLRALLAGLTADELRFLVLFSSSTARFGRTGQVDYAMANEALNKLAWQISVDRPVCRVISLNWGPWDGGMVTPALRELFAREGVGVINLQAGAQQVVEELRSAILPPREVVVLARGSAIPAGPSSPAVSGVQLPPSLPLAFSRQLDLADHPILTDHVLDGQPVLPVVLLLEWLAHAALVNNPGLVFHGCDELRVLKGVVIEGTPPQLRFGAGKASRKQGLFVAPTEVRSVQPDGREILHARAEVILASTLPTGSKSTMELDVPDCSLSPLEAYRQGLLFHGPKLHAIEAIEACGEAGIIGRVRTAPPVAQWLKQPLRQQWLADPMALDGALQLLIVWSQLQRGAGNLPCHVGRYRQYGRVFPADGVRVVARIARVGGLHLLADLDLRDGRGQLIAQMESVECVIDANLGRAYRRNVVVAS